MLAKQLPGAVRCIPYTSIRHIYYEMTSKVSVSNTTIWLPARKGQLRIDTWHGGGAYKSMNDGTEVKASESMLTRFASRNITLFLSSNRYFSEHAVRGSLQYQGEIIECGMPRNDILIHCTPEKMAAIRQRVYDWFHLSEELNLILYAPTWRYATGEKIQEFDIGQVLKAYKARFCKKAILLYRAHLLTTTSPMDNVIDATAYPDMQELLLACDMLISDYSSCIWDFSFTYKPCVLYTPDLEKYRRERGFVKDISEWHFPYYEDNESLVRGIENFDEEEFASGMKQHHEDLGSCETGEATKIVCDRIHDFCFVNSNTGGEP